jgi:phenylpropionate dioxygenase-like ring-hydroxylating dioxygenase large terminal subunit
MIEGVMTELGKVIATAEELEAPVTIGPDAYVSPEYARAEQDRLWRKVWLQAGRLEDIPAVGDFVTYDILSDSVIIMRTGPEALIAFHNVCPTAAAG